MTLENEEVVAVVKPDHIQIRLKEIHQFLAIKEMHLAIQFLFSETSLHSLEELELQGRGRKQTERTYVLDAPIRGPQRHC